MRKTFINLIFVFLSLIFSIFLVLPQPAFASSDFTTDYHVTYSVNPNGQTHAQLTGTLTNTTTEYYASSYKMQLGFDNISNVKASDPDGIITPKITKNADGYVIGLTFNKRSVGMGSKLPFSISFDTPTIARQFGKIWEINIPGIANPEDFSSFVVTVVVPPSFGKAAYIKPAQATNGLTFTKDQLGKSGISIAFGDKQLYAFHLLYHLHNENVYPVRTEIALPPTTNYQEVYINTISPQPTNVVKDTDGNWLAQYRLLPAQKLDITVEGVSQMGLEPSLQPLSQSALAQYTKPQPYWETNDPSIKALGKELKTPEAIYDYVVKTLTYDFSRVTDDKSRLGAAGALKNPTSAVCLEFTDLFIALARSAGIPAREVDGFAYTENAKQRPLSLVQDILHAWPEYYDTAKQTWVMVDPTWGSTTGGVDYFHVLDYDHFAFVIKGHESDYPIPAGGYKYLDTKNTKDVNVSFADSLPATTIDANVTTSFSQVSIAGLPISGKVTLKNTGTQELPPQMVSVLSDILTPRNQTLTSDYLPPFGSQTWDVTLHSQSFLTKAQTNLTIHFAPDSQLATKTVQKPLKVAPFFLTIWGIGGIICGILAIILFIIAYKIRRLHLLK